ncbi:REC8 meiotic recombination protein b [Thalassophryne amazonica]|uniref:REC8 meiotic recombination protein b n=1 Tax=Thalassophryne amazonica TaxID=390379 RepID=UPI00147172FA|nr:REC8 meiotic recombination protein b [Thalassophryne amazonica]
MFFYPNVLHRHTGCFSTIWLAATRGVRVTRRELLKVNVRRTCGDIMAYVTAEVPAPQPNLPKPRFSLYLSSQLQYGVVVVFHRQCGFLLEEVQHTIDRLLRSQMQMRIDMADPDRLALDLPDNLNMMNEAEGAQDPFFGLVESHQLPSPYNVQQQELLIEKVISQHSLVYSTHVTHDNEDFKSPPAAITLKEPLVITAAEGFEGLELTEVTNREIDLLMDQRDQFLREAEEQQYTQAAVSSVDQLKETVVGTERDSLWILAEKTGPPLEGPPASTSLEMTPVQVAMPVPPSRSPEEEGELEKESSDGQLYKHALEGSCGRVNSCSHNFLSTCACVFSQSSFGKVVFVSLPHQVLVHPTTKRSRSRRRQLVFTDPHIQISEEMMKEQIRNLQAETLDLSEMLLVRPFMIKHATPAQLFSGPSGSLLHTDLQSLWKQCALLPTLHTYQGGEEEKDEEEESTGHSEQDREILRRMRQSGMKEMHSESGLHPTEPSSASDVILDMSKEDKSLSDVITPFSRWSPQKEPQLPMEPISEENIVIPEAESGEILSWISSSLQTCGEITFSALLPPEADRTTAAHTLSKLLELLSDRQVIVQQNKPYSDIIVKPGALTVMT